MRRTVLLMVSLGTIFLGTINAQIKISSNNKLILANASEDELSESVDATVRDFFNLAQNSQRAEWEQLLASNCFKDGIPQEFVNNWFDHLACQKVNYTIVEMSSPKTNQRIISYTSSPVSDKKKTMVLVKEKGRWKVYHAGI
jgi:hypothetical protein